jgi:hypothetical protein
LSTEFGFTTDGAHSFIFLNWIQRYTLFGFNPNKIKRNIWRISDILNVIIRNVAFLILNIIEHEEFIHCRHWPARG